MEPLRKRVLGYYPAQVDIVIAELNDEIISLRQKILNFDKKVDVNADSAVVAQLVSEIEMLRSELDHYKSQGDVADSYTLQEDNDLLRSEVARQAAEIEKLTSMENEMALAMAVKDATISDFRKKLTEAAEQYNDAVARHRTPDMQVINRLYNHALCGAKDITVEARECVSALVDRVHAELRDNTQNSASAYGELIAAKREMSAFVAQGMGHLKSLEKMLGNICDADLKTPEIFNSLEETSSKIVEDMNTNLLTFNLDLDTQLETAVNLQFDSSSDAVAAPAAAAKAEENDSETVVNKVAATNEVEVTGESAEVQCEFVTEGDDDSDAAPMINIQDMLKKYSNVSF